MTFRATRVFAALALCCFAAGRADAQPNPNLRPTYGSATLRAGFLPDPHTLDLQAGGQLRTNLGGVGAYVARAPDFSLHYTQGRYPLSFFVRSVGDTTLLINLPDGRWIADDDGGGGYNPLIRLNNPPSGRYDIYVGTYRKDLLPATLFITERDAARPPPPPPPPPNVVVGNLPDCYIVSAGIDDYRSANKLNGCLNDARNIVSAFKAQAGARFRNVHEQILLDRSATRSQILGRFQGMTRQGKAGDFMVLFVSGHGGRGDGNRVWFFLPYDYDPRRAAQTLLTDRQILDVADTLVRQGKNVAIVVDACFSGQLAITARPYFQRYQRTGGGGLIVMLSSAAHQVSTALGNYSAYAKALSDTMGGAGDLDRNGKITLNEVRTASQRLTDQLLAQARSSNKQNVVVAWSPSISGDMPFAYPGRVFASRTSRPLPAEAPVRWVGNETLAGYGKLSFSLYSNGKAVMVDAKQSMEGIWRRQEDRITLAFANGAIVYSGTLRGGTLSGTASSPSGRQDERKTWSWTVQRGSGG